jgi:hypothetical protein
MGRVEPCRIEGRRIEVQFAFDLRVIFTERHFVIDMDLDPGSYPAALQLAVVDEANIIDGLGVLARRLNLAHEQQRIFFHPELSRFKVSFVSPNNVNGVTIPGIVANFCEVVALVLYEVIIP